MKYRIEFLDPDVIVIHFCECAELLCSTSIQRQRQRDWFLNDESYRKPDFKVGCELFNIDGVAEIFKEGDSFRIIVKCGDIDYDSYVIIDHDSEEFIKECSRFVNLTAINEKFLNEWDSKIQQILMAVKSCYPKDLSVDMEWKQHIDEPYMRKYDCRTRHRHEMISKCYLVSNM